MSDLTPEQLRAQLEAQEQAADEQFINEINAVCKRFKRLLNPVPVLVSDGGTGMKISARIEVQRSA